MAEFTCGDVDLDEFLREDAWAYHEEMFAQTWIWEEDQLVVGYVSMVNDRIATDNLDSTKRDSIRLCREELGKNPMSSGQIPAVKLARLAINSRFKGQGRGSALVVEMAALFASRENRTGCRLMTVDAYLSALAFYEKLGFRPQAVKLKPGSETIPMVIDLKRFRT